MLRGDNLATVQAALGCMRALERTDTEGRTYHGGTLIAEALYDVIAADGIDAGTLAELLPADTGGLLGAADSAVRLLGRSPQLKADLVALIGFLLAPDHVRPALDGGLALLEVGGLSEIINALTGVLGSIDCDPDQTGDALVARALGMSR